MAFDMASRSEITRELGEDFRRARALEVTAPRPAPARLLDARAVVRPLRIVGIRDNVAPDLRGGAAGDAAGVPEEALRDVRIRGVEPAPPDRVQRLRLGDLRLDVVEVGATRRPASAGHLVRGGGGDPERDREEERRPPSEMPARVTSFHWSAALPDGVARRQAEPGDETRRHARVTTTVAGVHRAIRRARRSASVSAS